MLFQSGRLEEALTAFDGVVQSYKASDAPILREVVARCFVNRGNVLAALKRETEALSSWEEAIRGFEAGGLPEVAEPYCNALMNRAAALKLIRFGGHPDTVQRRCPMSKTHPPYAPEYRRQMVELVRTGRTPGELAREFECSAQAIRNWVRQADRDDGRREDGLTTLEREELRRLRREVRQLREEREILAKATAWFARETGSVRAKSSSS